MIAWFAAVLAVVFLFGARRLILGSHRHPARRADCPVVQDGTCGDDHDCESHS